MSLFIILIILLISISISTSISKSNRNKSRRSKSNTSDKSKHQENNSESIQGEPIEPIEITDAPKVVAKDIDSSKMVEAPKTSQELVIYQPTLKPFSSKQTMFYDFRRNIEDILRRSERISLNPDSNQDYQNCIDNYQVIHPHVDNYIIQGYCYYKFTTLDIPMKKMIDWSKNIFLVCQSMYNAGMTIEQIRPYLFHYKLILPELKPILKAKSSPISDKKTLKIEVDFRPNFIYNIAYDFYKKISEGSSPENAGEEYHLEPKEIRYLLSDKCKASYESSIKFAAKHALDFYVLLSLSNSPENAGAMLKLYPNEVNYLLKSETKETIQQKFPRLFDTAAIGALIKIPRREMAAYLNKIDSIRKSGLFYNHLQYTYRTPDEVGLSLTQKLKPHEVLYLMRFAPKNIKNRLKNKFPEYYPDEVQIDTTRISAEDEKFDADNRSWFQWFFGY